MYPLGNQQATAAYQSVYSPAMRWTEIRDAYERSFRAAQKRGDGVTQESVAKAGGLKRQNLISKFLANDKLGPQVETFIRAVEGLGLRPSDFFRQIETGAKPAMPLAVPPVGVDDEQGDPLAIRGPAVSREDFRRIGLAYLAAAEHAPETPRSSRSMGKARRSKSRGRE